jgi:hypothetical protein
VIRAARSASEDGHALIVPAADDRQVALRDQAASRLADALQSRRPLS